RQRDSEVNPFARWRGFEFEVTRSICRIGREEDLADVTVPESERLSVSYGIRRNYERFALDANKAHVQRFVGPANSRFSMPRRGSRRAGPQTTDPHRLTLLPDLVLEVRLSHWPRHKARTNRCVRIHNYSNTLRSTFPDLRCEKCAQCCASQTSGSKTPIHPQRRQYRSNTQ